MEGDATVTVGALRPAVVAAVLLAISLGLWLAGTRSFLSRFLRRQRRRIGARLFRKGRAGDHARQARQAHPEKRARETADRLGARAQDTARRRRRSGAVSGDKEVGEAGVDARREQRVDGYDTPHEAPHSPGRANATVRGLVAYTARQREAGRARHERDSPQARVASAQQGPRAEHAQARHVERPTDSPWHDIQLDEVRVSAARYVREQLRPPRQEDSSPRINHDSEHESPPDLYAWVLQFKREHEARLAERERTLLPGHCVDLLLSGSENTRSSSEKALTFHHLDEDIEAAPPDWHEWMQLFRRANASKVHGLPGDYGQHFDQVAGSGNGRKLRPLVPRRV